MKLTKKEITYIFLLLGINIIIRGVLYLVSEPITGQDTSGYERLADSFASGDYNNYTGDRTPVFPLVILLNNFNYSWILLTHFLMGTLISMLIFLIFVNLKMPPVVSFIGGLSYSVHIPLIGRELYIATETTAIFFTVILFFLIVMYHKRALWKNILLFCIAIVISILTLTRPAFLVLIPFIFLLLIVFDRIQINSWDIKPILRKLIIYLIPIIILIGGWCQFNNMNLNKFTITTFKGYSLINSVGSLMVDAPDKFEPYKSIYIEKHSYKIREEGKYYNAVHLCTDTLMQTLDLKFWELSEKWEEIAFTLIKQHPGKYFAETLKGFRRNWKPMGFYKSDNKIIIAIRQLEQIMVLVIQFLFFCIPVFLFLTRKERYFQASEIFLIAHVFLISLGISGISAAVEYGDPRFSLPYLPLIVISVLFFYTKLFMSHRQVKRQSEN